MVAGLVIGLVLGAAGAWLALRAKTAELRVALEHEQAGSAEKLERVEVGGSAVIVARGEFRF